MSPDERVAAGVRWLDEHEPGWRDRIDVETLDVGDPCGCCPLSQVAGGRWYYDVLADAGLKTEDSVRFGFDRDEGESVDVWAELQAAWERVLR
jgi:hypothetical protein